MAQIRRKINKMDEQLMAKEMPKQPSILEGLLHERLDINQGLNEAINKLFYIAQRLGLQTEYADERQEDYSETNELLALDRMNNQSMSQRTLMIHNLISALEKL